ncbi:MAG: hypothetical protein IJ606_03385 [Bacteroidaceae bacterium]|nr:hypothetical protein [Bacteroidaceae bacterium]
MKTIYKWIFMYMENGKARDRSPHKLVRIYYVFWYYLSRLVENILVRIIPNRLCVLNRDERGERIVASLTSYPGRIGVVEYSIKSILLQTIPPHRIILWLANSQFPGRKLPKSLSNYIRHGLEVRWVNDLRSHKKYHYVLQEQESNEVVITFDDDIIYHPLTIEHALRKHAEYPNAVVANMMMKIGHKNGNVVPFRQWQMIQPGVHCPRTDYALLTGSGCLYPFGVMPKETFDWDEACRMAKTCDDLWITFMTKLYNVPVCPTDYTSPDFCTSYGSQATHLAKDNMLNDGNDKCVALFVKEHPEIVSYMLVK